VMFIAEHILGFFGRKYHRPSVYFTEAALEALKRHPWPGNIRELRNTIERAVILSTSDRVEVEDISGQTTVAGSLPRIGDAVSLAKIEEEHIRRVLAGSKSLQDAADTLGIDQATLWRRRKRYGI
jgi:two-component system, NtrC family, response regulator AlgB